MSHIGILCPPHTSHINLMAALGRELQGRGHRLTAFGIPDVEAKVRSEGIDYCAIGQQSHPAGAFGLFLAGLETRKGISALGYVFKTLSRINRMLFAELPDALRSAGVEGLLVDESEPVGGTIADHLGLPFVTICNGLPRNREDGVPPNFTPWVPEDAWWGNWRNRLGYTLFDWLSEPIARDIRAQRRAWKLPAYRAVDDCFSDLAQISQIVAEFDFPRRDLPACFHYTGPIRNRSPRQVDFPYERLDGRPLIYASLGTVFNGKAELFRTIAAACAPLEAQLVLSLGGGGRLSDYAGLPGDPLVVEYAPQVELLKRASLTITHAGLNTALESLGAGVPMVAIPISADQPAVAARVEWNGCGEVLPLGGLSVTQLREVAQRVLLDSDYKDNARRLQRSLQRSGGVIQASDIIEEALSARQPVLATR